MCLNSRTKKKYLGLLIITRPEGAGKQMWRPPLGGGVPNNLHSYKKLIWLQHLHRSLTHAKHGRPWVTFEQKGVITTPLRRKYEADIRGGGPGPPPPPTSPFSPIPGKKTARRREGRNSFSSIFWPVPHFSANFQIHKGSGLRTQKLREPKKCQILGATAKERNLRANGKGKTTQHKPAKTRTEWDWKMRTLKMAPAGEFLEGHLGGTGPATSFHFP